jgi:anti-sigma-K factor RskA
MIIGISTLVSNLMGTIDRQNVQLVELRDELTRKEELLKVLASRQIEVTAMNGLQVNPVGYGKIIWDPEKGTAILQVSNLPAVPSNKDYQLWVIKGKQPISAGVFAVHNKDLNFFKIENLAVTNPKEIAAFAITLEPKGGVPSPTGQMFMAGSPKL